jgi:hypothetical protein
METPPLQTQRAALTLPRTPPATRARQRQAYYVWYCPGSILALWMMERHGMRLSLLVGFASQVVMIVLTVTGVHLAEPHVAYGVVWVAQARGARARGGKRARMRLAGRAGGRFERSDDDTVCVCRACCR